MTKKHWRSLAELDNTPEFRAFLEAEFPETSDAGGFNRRRWLQIMGASFALAGVAGCEAKKHELLPFANRPEGRIPGEPQRFATSFDLNGHAVGLLVTCVDGRPIKVEGNPLHPQSLGASSGLAQSAVLTLYDPDRSQYPVEAGNPDSITHGGGASEGDKWAKFDALLTQKVAELKPRNGAGLCILTEATSSPTVDRLRKQLLTQMPEAKWFEYEPLTDDNVRAGSRAAFDQVVAAHLDLSKAQIILSLDSDLLVEHPAALQYTRAFSKGREVVDGKMNRLYVVESGFSLTGASADHRLPVRPSQVPAFAGRLLRTVEHLIDPNAPAVEPTGDAGLDKFINVLAGDLQAHRGACVVSAGPQQPAEVHAIAHRLNAILGNVGQTVQYTTVAAPDRPGHLEAITALTTAMQSGSVDTLIILGGNPVYTAPVDVKFVDGLAKVPTSIHLGLYRDETGRLCKWHLPQAHFLESWGDVRSFDGTYGVVQPTIEALHGGRTSLEILARVLGETAKPDELIKATAQAIAGEKFNDSLWRKTLHDGLLEGSAWPVATVAEAKPCEVTTAWQRDLPANGTIELVFVRDASLFDGRFANNSWLQECPDPLTKLTWDNAAVMSPATAKALGVVDEVVVQLQAGDQTVEISTHVMPGWAEGVIGVSLGYGREAAGSVGGLVDQGTAPVGVNVYPLRTSQSLYVNAGVTAKGTTRRYPLSTTQDHHAIDVVGLKERARSVPILVREGSLTEYLAHDDFAQHIGHAPESLESMWQEIPFTDHRWGMSIDLSKCVGCNACVVACQAENNVPVVGKAQIKRGREMHWIRVDRYFLGEAEDPQSIKVSMQPVACHHCELAPCEQVCPVAATVHSSEGLNDMVYNRCIGTRYCGNNCPYKVRRFNYFNYHKDLNDPSRETAKMVYNPEVTVRSRGVMEKCTYCVQRIQAVKIQTKNAREPIADGSIQTACQQACPAQAIVFGDLADPKSQVTTWQKNARSYAMLAELNIKPRTTYLARIRNTHPELTPPAPAEHAEHAGNEHG